MVHIASHALSGGGDPLLWVFVWADIAPRLRACRRGHHTRAFVRLFTSVTHTAMDIVLEDDDDDDFLEAFGGGRSKKPVVPVVVAATATVATVPVTATPATVTTDHAAVPSVAAAPVAVAPSAVAAAVPPALAAEVRLAAADIALHRLTSVQSPLRASNDGGFALETDLNGPSVTLYPLANYTFGSKGSGKVGRPMRRG